MFTWRSSIKLHDTDAAGVMFFGNQFKLAHDCYESMMASIGYPLGALMRDADFLPLIVRAEADYNRPLLCDDQVELTLTLEKVGDSSYVIVQEIRNGHGDLTGTVRTVHVAMDKATKRKCSLPDAFRAALNNV